MRKYTPGKSSGELLKELRHCHGGDGGRSSPVEGGYPCLLLPSHDGVGDGAIVVTVDPLDVSRLLQLPQLVQQSRSPSCEREVYIKLGYFTALSVFNGVDQLSIC